MSSLSLYPQFETNLTSNRNVELLLQLKSAKAHGKNYIRVKTHLVRHLLRDCLLAQMYLKSFLTFTRNYVSRTHKRVESLLGEKFIS